MHLKPSHFCIVHKTFTCWFPQTFNSWQPQTATLLFSLFPSPPVISLSKPGIKTHPTNWSPQDNQHHTCPHDKHTGSILLTAMSTAPFPFSREYHQFPVTRNGKEPLLLLRSLTSLPGQTPREAASLGAPPPPLKPDKQVEVWHYL